MLPWCLNLNSPDVSDQTKFQLNPSYGLGAVFLKNFNMATMGVILHIRMRAYLHVGIHPELNPTYGLGDAF